MISFQEQDNRQGSQYSRDKAQGNDQAASGTDVLDPQRGVHVGGQARNIPLIKRRHDPGFTPFRRKHEQVAICDLDFPLHSIGDIGGLVQVKKFSG